MKPNKKYFGALMRVHFNKYVTEKQHHNNRDSNM